MKPHDPTPKPLAAAVPPSDDRLLTTLQRTMLAFYAGSSPELLDEIRNIEIRNMNLKPTTDGGQS